MFLSYDETLKNMLKAVPKWRVKERVPLSGAFGRVLAVDVRAEAACPEFATASMDGYACKAADLKEGAMLKVVGALPAGSEPSVAVGAGECVKTFTGSLMSEGADTLLPIENVTAEGDGIWVDKPVSAGFAVRAVGESYEEGELLLSRGAELGFSEIALLAELGLSWIDVLARPRVGILSTGSEICDLGARKSRKSQIYSSNNVAIATLVRSLGCEALMLPVVADNVTALKEAIEGAIASCDFLVTTGGVSVGDFDFMRDFVKSRGELLVDKAAIKPGRHIKVAKMEGKFIFALPGFAYSSAVTFLLYFREFLAAMLGTGRGYRFKAVLANDYAKKSPFEEFSAATLVNENGTLKISTQGMKRGSSAIISNLNKNAVLLVCPQNRADGLKAGEIVEFIQI